MQGERPYPKKAKGLPSRPPTGVPLSVPAENGLWSLPLRRQHPSPISPERAVRRNRPHRCWRHRAGRSCWNTSGSAPRSRRQFAALYRAPMERYAELVQAFPASEAHHHAYPGGMLDHGLEIVAYSLKLRQSSSAAHRRQPEDQAAQAEAWTAAVAYAALLHDIGKIAVDLHVELADGSTLAPCGTARCISHTGFRYRDDREYRLHSAATGLLYRQLLDREVLDWLSCYPSLWAPLLYVLAGQYEHWRAGRTRGAGRPSFRGPGTGRRSTRAMAAP